MKKVIISLVSVFMLSSSLVSASSLNGSVSPSSVLSANDQAMLFDGQVNALVLDNEEMRNTQGEFWPILIGLAISSLSWLNAPGLNESTFHGKPPFRW